ncbi:hypothetical protein LXA43DRAFT_908193, partial [Ganoderma leucocontextum]
MLRSIDPDILRRYQSSAQALARKVASRLHSVQPPLCPLAQQPIRLSLPTSEPLTARLLFLGVDERYAERISAAVAQAEARFKESCEASFQQRRQTLLSRPFSSLDPDAATALSRHYTTIYSKLMADWASYILDTFAPRFVNAQELYKQLHETRGRSPSFKQSFNQDAVPILEQFFVVNAFPSRLEKYDLASKCEMSYKQINTWFQNHRTRVRKEGGVLKKLEVADKFVDDFENAVMDALLPRQDDLEDDVPVPRTSSSSSPYSELECSTAPRHAFPTPYPPCHPDDP